MRQLLRKVARTVVPKPRTTTSVFRGRGTVVEVRVGAKGEQCSPWKTLVWLLESTVLTSSAASSTGSALRKASKGRSGSQSGVEWYFLVLMDMHYWRWFGLTGAGEIKSISRNQSPDERLLILYK